jgi:hypothetical protein
VTTPEVHEYASTYTVCALPEDDTNADAYEITVERRGPGRWAVMHNRYCLGADGTWDYESGSDKHDDEWLASHRFGLDRALEFARAAAPNVTVNGCTATTALTRSQGRTS